VTFPVNFISAFLVDGRVDNLVNIFSGCNISAGDDLIMKLEKLPISVKEGGIRYHLNHWAKQTAIQQFKYEDGGVNEAWQLVPGVLSTYAPRRLHEDYDYRENGYWHLLRSQVMARTEAADDWRYEASNKGVYYDDRVGLRGALLEGTFEPVWVEHIHWKPKKGEKRVAEDDAPQPKKSSGWGWWGGGGGSGGGGDGGGGGDNGGDSETPWDAPMGEKTSGGVKPRFFGFGRSGERVVAGAGGGQVAGAGDEKVAATSLDGLDGRKEYVPKTTTAASNTRRPTSAPPAGSETGSVKSMASSTDGATATFQNLVGDGIVAAAAFPAAATKKPRRVGLAVNVTSDSKLPVLVESVAGEGGAL
jgi:hypothetical protein